MINIQLLLAVQQGDRFLFNTCTPVRPCVNAEDTLFDLLLHHDHEQLLALMLGKEDSRSIFIGNFNYQDPDASKTMVVNSLECIEAMVTTGIIALAFTNGEWKLFSKVEDCITEGFLSLNYFLKKVFADEQKYPEDVVDHLMQFPEYPLIVNLVEEYENHDLLQFRPLFAEHPAQLAFEDNMVLESV